MGMVEKRPHGMSTNDWVERLIQEARERGEFDNLKGSGKPLPGLDKPYDPDWWIKRKLEREQIPVAPELIRLRREAEQLAEQLPRLPGVDAVQRQVNRINGILRKANTLPGPPGLQVAALFDEKKEVEKWRKRR